MAESPDPGRMRNICILAHVDHGKTTLADHLIASAGGGILHPRMAGRLKFMDFLDEEQRRAITMKSSSVSLRHRGFSFNLVDSPGHMDFCSEVSTAARISDGALVLVDAVEGVHIQTHAVLRQAWTEKLTPCLVLNKIDRLISELKLTPMEAYSRLLRIVHEVNGIVSAYKSEKYLSEVDLILSSPSTSLPGSEESSELFVEDDEEDTFQPHKGNVVFACAYDGWGFSVHDFAEFYAAKLGASSAALRKALWGPWYYNPKTKMIGGKKSLEKKARETAKPMFVQFVLEQLWPVYQSGIEGCGDRGILDKVVKTFGLDVPDREMKNKDPKIALQAVMSRWLPLADSVLSMVINCLPDPVTAQKYRISRLIPKREVSVLASSSASASASLAEAERARASVEACDSSPEAPCVAFVSKMFSVPAKMLPKRGFSGESIGDDEDEGGSGECFLAFARVFSGVLRAGQSMYVLSALYDPLKQDDDSMEKHIQVAELSDLYLMMGQGLQFVDSARAGNVVAIRGLGHHILKSATLSSTKDCWPFSSMAFQVSPTLRVAIEPSDPADMGALMKGLKLLNRADPFVEVSVSGRGEHVLAAAGEVHLERCVKDLKERFARVNLEVSPPLVSYKETVQGEECKSVEYLKSLMNPSDFVEKTTANGRCVVRVRVMNLPPSLTKILEESSDLLADIIGVKSDQARESDAESLRKRMIEAVESDIASENDNDKDRAEKCRIQWMKLLKKIWALGPRRIGPNILFTSDPEETTSPDSAILVRGSPHVSKQLGFWDEIGANEHEATVSSEAERLETSVVSGFQLATAAGPLCDEPLWGLAFVVETRVSPAVSVSSSPENSSDETATAEITSSSHQNSGQQSEQFGQVMTAVKEACRAAVLGRKPRLVEAMYFCELNTLPEYLGSMYAVIARRRARVIKEEMQEGSASFTVHAYVPVSESFGFADQLRRETAGGASALLVLSHWEILPQDPFFVPKTEEEIEEFGDGSSVLHNTARKLVDNVRRRKGLPVEEKVVQHATKQRTLARKV